MWCPNDFLLTLDEFVPMSLPSVENNTDGAFGDFVHLMQGTPRNEECQETYAEPCDFPVQDILTEELADLVEEIEVENMTADPEETKKTQNSEHELLYGNARITVGESLLLTMAFIMRHKLSMVASDDLISLLELHCPAENNAVKGLGKFKEYFQYLKHPMKKHFCCPNRKCQVYISATKPEDGDVCHICSQPLSGKSFFIELPVEDQLKTILSRKFCNSGTFKYMCILGQKIY